MSYHRENVTWQSKDGLWSIGFWSFYDTKHHSDPDFDSEWDVEYTYDSFWWVSTGHRTPRDAYLSYPGGNPGGTETVPYKGHSQEAKKYDNLAWRFLNPEAAKAEDKKKLAASIRSSNRAVQAKVDEGFTLHLGGKVSAVTYRNNDYGFYQANHYGLLKQKGDWLTLEDVKIFNTKTKKVARNLTSIEKVITRSPRWR